ncbi:MAG TPA: AIR synthase related protein [Streptosporangiaceae bacterium]|nr:AIR synthase related protein [Streptosporangiaceae bacterium]
MDEARYASAGVSYELLDAAKKLAAAQALATAPMLEHRGGSGIDASRGEPAFVFKLGDRSLALVLECLGTKSVIARQYLAAGGPDRFGDIGYDAVAAIVNDLCCVGALPLVVNAYFATGSSNWQHDASGRYSSLVTGWRRACETAGATWGGGETSSLTGIVFPDEIDIAGTAVGEVPPGHPPILGQDLAPGDDIVLIASSGLHANGASLARTLADELPDGYLTRLPGGRHFGAALLDPTVIYVPLVESLLRRNVPVSYLSHITGHGLRKVMRAKKELAYRIHDLPPVPEVLRFITERTGMSPHEAYGTFNMGAGFAVFCGAGSGRDVVGAASEAGLAATVAGVVEAGQRRVIVEPLAVTYETDELQLS